MSLRTGQMYRESLEDDREIWLAGQRVRHVPTHPAFGGCVSSVAALYDLQHDPSCRDILTIDSPDSGERVSLAYLLPRTREDLQRRRGMIEFLARLNGGTMGRLPDYVPLILLGLVNQRQFLAQYNAEWSQNITTYFGECRERDLCLSHSFADPQIDRSRPSGELSYLHIAQKREEGIVVRGIKTVATLAPYGNEYLVLTPPRAGLVPAQLVFFAMPIATPGLRFMCREPFSLGNAFDHPLSSRFDEMDAWAIFDDVFVPRERIFLSENIDAVRAIWRQLNIWAFYHILIRMAVKAELFVGVCALITEAIGTLQFPNVREALAEVIRYLETLRAFLSAAEADAIVTRAGLIMPNPKTVMIGHMYAMEHHPRLLQTVMSLSGQNILMAPSQADLESADFNRAVGRYLAETHSASEERSRLFKLAWDLACSSFAARQLLFELFNGRDLTKNRLDFVQSYDTSPYKEVARRLAGIQSPAVQQEPAPGKRGDV